MRNRVEKMPLTTLYIKNMVCDRCRMSVDKVLRDNGLHPVDVQLGVAQVEGDVDDELRAQLADALQALGFELLADRRRQVVEQIRASVIRLVHYRDNRSETNLSDYLQQELHMEYSSLSKLFSEVTGTTIERYYIEQRIERVKELLTYGELTLTQIAFQLHYSSVAYLSSQFKMVTGITPSAYKSLQCKDRRALDQI